MTKYEVKIFFEPSYHPAGWSWTLDRQQTSGFFEQINSGTLHDCENLTDEGAETARMEWLDTYDPGVEVTWLRVAVDAWIGSWEKEE